MNIEQDTDSVSSDKKIQSKDLQINIYSKSYSAYIETRKKKKTACLQPIFFNYTVKKM